MAKRKRRRKVVPVLTLADIFGTQVNDMHGFRGVGFGLVLFCFDII